MILGTLVTVATGHGELRHVVYPTRPLDGIEAYEALVDDSQLLLIARVIRVDSTTVPVPEFPELTRRRCLLEPVEWLHGGLDGDEVEVFFVDKGISDVRHFRSWPSLAGIDSLGVLVRLHRIGSDWTVMPWFRILPQRSIKAVRDSIVHARERTGIDSLAARADLIVVVADSTHIVKRAKLDSGVVRVVRRLKGEDSSPQISIRPWQQFRCAAREVVFLKRIGPALYEPLPFHSSSPPEFNDGDSEWERQPFATETAVRRALKRIGTARAGKPEQH